MSRACKAPGQRTPYSRWLYERYQGFGCWNVDYVNRSYTYGKWCYVEEKRHMGGLTWHQEAMFGHLDRVARQGTVDGMDYAGFFVVQFEFASPLKGRIFVDGQLVCVEELDDFNRFVHPTLFANKKPGLTYRKTRLLSAEQESAMAALKASRQP